MSYENTKAHVEKSLQETGLEYIDLMLIHAPYGGTEARKGAWKALVEAQEEGKIRSLGVSNYGVHHLDEMEVNIKELEKERGEGKGGAISVGQWELHPVSLFVLALKVFRIIDCPISPTSPIFLGFSISVIPVTFLTSHSFSTPPIFPISLFTCPIAESNIKPSGSPTKTSSNGAKNAASSSKPTAHSSKASDSIPHFSPH